MPILAGYGFLGITKGIYMSSLGLGVWVALLSGIIIYGGSASVLGAVLGDFVPFSTEGIEFVMTAVFVVIFIEQWLRDATAGPGCGRR